MPRALLAALLLLLSAQIAWRALQPPPVAQPERLGYPPPAPLMRSASLDEPIPAAGLAALWLQTVDNPPGVSLPLAALDYQRVGVWLRTLMALDPRADAPLLLASHVYAQVPDPVRQRLMLGLTHEAFFEDPDRRWRWLAHAALLAKHRLHDLPLALTYARAIAQHARGRDVPHWAQQMVIFILEDMGELEAARIELGALLATGTVRDPQERRFLTQRYLELERELAKSRQVR